MCDDDNPENWEEILADTPEEFKQAILKYAKENLIKMHLFISSPFTTAYQRYIETTKINFIANVGGKSVKYFIQNIFKYFFRINGIVYGLQFCQPNRNHLLLWKIIVWKHHRIYKEFI